MTRWRCRRLRAGLVDVACGVVDESRRRRVNRHTASCRRCAASLAALREVPASLREAEQPVRDEAVWRRQRQDIMRAVRNVSEPADNRAWLPRAGWQAGFAVAAAVLVAAAGYRWMRPPVASSDRSAVRMAQLDAATIVALADLVGLPMADDEFGSTANWADGDLIGGWMERGWIDVDEDDWTPALDDLSEGDLDALNGLIGAAVG